MLSRLNNKIRPVLALGAAMAVAGGVLPAQSAQATASVQKLTGTVDVVVVDRHIGEDSGDHADDEPATAAALETQVSVATSRGTLAVPSSLSRGLRAGQKVTVTATRPVGRFGASSASGSLDGVSVTAVTPVARFGAASTAPALPSPVGQHTLTVLPVYWSSPDSQTQASLQDLAARTAAYWSNQSGGAIQIATSTRNWAQISEPIGCNSSTIFDRALAAHGVSNPSSITQHVMIYFPYRSDCGGWAGLGSVVGSRIWVNGYALLDVTAHEFGHNIGLGHANRAVCAASGVTPSSGPRQTLTTNCEVQAYQDSADVMGYATSSPSGTLNTALADQLGLVTTATATTSSAIDVELHPVTSVGQLRAMKVRAPSGWVYVDYRPAASPDTRRSAWAGLQVHYLPDGGYPQSQLLDLQPWQSATFTSTSMPANSVWQLPLNIGVTVSVVSVGATARIRAVPTASDTIAPTTPAVTYAAGRLDWTASTDGGAGLAGYRVSVNGAPSAFLPPSATGTEVSVPSGASSLVLDAVDAAGNVAGSGNLLGSGGSGGSSGSGSSGGSGSSSGLAAPVITAPNAGLLTRSRSTVLSWNAPAGFVTGYQVFVNGQPVGRVLKPSVRKAKVSLPQGEVTLGVAARDLSSTLGTRGERQITVDSIKPSLPTQLSLPGGSSTLSWAATSDAGTPLRYEVRVNGVPVANTNANSATVSATGRLRLTVQAFDSAGNKSSAARLTAMR